MSFLPILLVFAISLVICLVLYGLSYLISLKEMDSEKLTSYECGFNSFLESSFEFEIKFFLVGVFFLVFDLEVFFFFPWSTALSFSEVFAFWSMFTFIVLLVVGIIYEWMKGGLEWQ